MDALYFYFLCSCQVKPSLPKIELDFEAFKYYLIQDYLYLIQFARADMLAGYKTKNFEDIVRSAEIVLHINRDLDVIAHGNPCAQPAPGCRDRSART